MNEVILKSDSQAIQYLSSKDKRLAKVISEIGELTYTVHDDPYSFIIHEIIEQMLSTKASQQIYSRLNTLCNGCISVESIMNLTDEQIRGVGTANRKVSFIRNFTNEIIAGTIDFSKLSKMSDQDVINCLTAIKGIGKWTAKMYLIFCLDRPNILPYEDVAFLQSYKWLYKTTDTSDSSVKKKCQKWSPYSSIAARYLYRALDSGLTKKEFHLYK